MIQAPNGEIKLDKIRQAIGTNFVTEVVDDGKGTLFSKVVTVVPDVHQTLGYPRGVRQDRPAEPHHARMQEVRIERTWAGRALRPALSPKVADGPSNKLPKFVSSSLLRPVASR